MIDSTTALEINAIKINSATDCREYAIVTDNTWLLDRAVVQLKELRLERIELLSRESA